MSGTLLGKDQIDKINASYSEICNHIKSLFDEAKDPVQLMKIHLFADYLDTVELARIFSFLPFISPAEKRALVRSAIFDVLLDRKVQQYDSVPTDNAGVKVSNDPAQLTTYVPRQFKLNVIGTDTLKESVPTTNDAPVPAVLTKVSDIRKEAVVRNETAQADREARAEEIQKTDAREL